MRRDDIISRIRKHSDAIRAEGAIALYLFGSIARDQAQADSDIDVFVDYALEQPCVRGVTFQPIQAAGRLDEAREKFSEIIGRHQRRDSTGGRFFCRAYVCARH